MKNDSLIKGVTYGVKIPSSRAEDIDLLMDFAERNDDPNMCIEYATEKDAKNRICVLKRVAKNEKYNVEIIRMENKVYARLTETDA